jgi:hypothetical protein
MAIEETKDYMEKPNEAWCIEEVKEWIQIEKEC